MVLQHNEVTLMYLPGEIHERIGDLRSSKGLSQKELSEIIGIVPSQLSRIESGKSRTSAATYSLSWQRHSVYLLTIYLD